MYLFVMPLLVSVLPAVDRTDMEVVDRLKQVGQVYAAYQREGKQRRVTRIDLRITGDKDARDVASALKELVKLPHLETVLLMGQAFTDDTIKELAAVESVRDVQLHRTRVTDDGVKALTVLPNLRRLVFSGGGLTDKGLQDIARMKELRYLEITDAPITDEGLEALRPLCELRRLTIVNSKATEAALRRLFQSLPQLESREPNPVRNI